VQKKYEGSDRHTRGVIMAELRATHAPLSEREIDGLWPDRTQLRRALDGLVSDGLALRTVDGYLLP
jgi:A/G-specific adenine glycosylase